MAGMALLDHFSALRDPRQSWEVVYPLPEVLLVVLCGTLAGAQDLVEIAQWSQAKLDFLRRLRPFRRGVPSHDTPGDVPGALDAKLFSGCFTAWVGGLRAGGPEFVAIDGKTSRRARRGEEHPLHLVSALWIGLRRSSPSGRIAARWPAAGAWCSAKRRPRPRATRSRPSRRCWNGWNRRAPSSASTPWAAGARSPAPSAAGAPTTCWRWKTTGRRSPRKCACSSSASDPALAWCTGPWTVTTAASRPGATSSPTTWTGSPPTAASPLGIGLRR